MSIPGSNGVIHSGLKVNGDIRIFDDSIDTVHNNESGLNWNQTGPQGPQGVQGIQGVTGIQGHSGPPGPSGVVACELIITSIDFGFPGGTAILQSDSGGSDTSVSDSQSGIIAIVDLDIPEGKAVVGSGGLLTHIRTDVNATPVTLTPISNAPSDFDWNNRGNVSVMSGPHPGNASKWRFVVDNLLFAVVRIKIWLIVV